MDEKCELCGEPMPKGEEMFRFHGYSGPCPKPPLPDRSFGDLPHPELATDGAWKRAISERLLALEATVIGAGIPLRERAK